MKTEVKMGLALGTALIVIVAVGYFYSPSNMPAKPETPADAAAKPLPLVPEHKAVAPVDTITTPGFGTPPASRPTTLAVDIFAPTTRATVPATEPAHEPEVTWEIRVGTGRGDMAGTAGPTGPSIGSKFGGSTGGTFGNPTPSGGSSSGSKGTFGGGMGGTAGTDTVYEVKSGDTFSTISTSVYGSPNYWAKIAAANPGVSSNRLRIGQKIKVPPLGEVKPAETSAPKHTPVGGSSLVRNSATEYQVQSGDTLTKIAQKLYGNGNRWEEIYKLNKAKIGDSPTKLKVGTVLALPSAPKTPATLPSR